MDINDIKFEDDVKLYIKTWALNEDGAKVLRTIEALKRNFKKYGAAYCPCKVEKIPENICPCKENHETGKCICGLYRF